MVTRAIGRDFISREMSSITEPFIWISIREPDLSDEFYENIILSPICKGILILYFHDLICDDYSEELINRLQSELKGFIPFDLKTKNKIDNFIDKYNEVNLCITNCYLGVSRSAAISAYIGRKTGETNWYEKYYCTCGKFPCFYICRILELPIPKLNNGSIA